MVLMRSFPSGQSHGTQLWYRRNRAKVQGSHEEVVEVVTRAVLDVPNISCEHCERTVRSTLEPLAGVQAVQVDIPARAVTVDYDEGTISPGEMSTALAEEDYPVAASRTG
jgi:copper chaperone CopZ